MLPLPTFLRDFATLPKSAWPSQSRLGRQWISWKWLYKARQMGISYCSPAELYFFSLICADSIPLMRRGGHQGQQGVLFQAKDQYGSTHCGLWLSLPLGFVFAAKQTNFLPNRFLAVKFRAFQAWPGSPLEAATKAGLVQRIMQVSPATVTRLWLHSDTF